MLRPGQSCFSLTGNPTLADFTGSGLGSAWQVEVRVAGAMPACVTCLRTIELGTFLEAKVLAITPFGDFPSALLMTGDPN